MLEELISAGKPRSYIAHRFGNGAQVGRSTRFAGVFVRDRELHDRRRPLSGMPAGFELGGRQRFCVHTLRPRFALGSGLLPDVHSEHGFGCWLL